MKEKQNRNMVTCAPRHGEKIIRSHHYGTMASKPNEEALARFRAKPYAMEASHE